MLGSSQLNNYLKAPQNGISAPKLRTSALKTCVSENILDVPPTGLLSKLREKENFPSELIPISQKVRANLTTIRQVMVIISRNYSLQKNCLFPSCFSLKSERLRIVQAQSALRQQQEEGQRTVIKK